MLRRRKPDRKATKRKIPKPGAPIRSQKHLKFVGQCFMCAVPGCNGWPVHAHHVTEGGNRGVSVKASDEWVVPLCAERHHTVGPKSVHVMGRMSFERHHGLCLAQLAKQAALLSPDLRIRDAARTMLTGGVDVPTG